MFTIKHSIEVELSADAVWAVLSDFESYSEWNPYILELRTRGEIGSDIILKIIQPNWVRPVTLHSKLVELDPENHELRWKSRLGIPGLYDTDHAIRVTQRGSDGCRVTQFETFSGIFAFLKSPAARKATRSTFALMNKSLRNRAEARSR